MWAVIMKLKASMNGIRVGNPDEPSKIRKLTCQACGVSVEASMNGICPPLEDRRAKSSMASVRPGGADEQTWLTIQKELEKNQTSKAILLPKRDPFDPQIITYGWINGNKVASLFMDEYVEVVVFEEWTAEKLVKIYAEAAQLPDFMLRFDFGLQLVFPN